MAGSHTEPPVIETITKTDRPKFDAMIPMQLMGIVGALVALLLSASLVSFVPRDEHHVFGFLPVETAWLLAYALNTGVACACLWLGLRCINRLYTLNGTTRLSPRNCAWIILGFAIAHIGANAVLIVARPGSTTSLHEAIDVFGSITTIMSVIRAAGLAWILALAVDAVETNRVRSKLERQGRFFLGLALIIGLGSAIPTLQLIGRVWLLNDDTFATLSWNQYLYGRVGHPSWVIRSWPTIAFSVGTILLAVLTMFRYVNILSSAEPRFHGNANDQTTKFPSILRWLSIVIMVMAGSTFIGHLFQLLGSVVNQPWVMSVGEIWFYISIPVMMFVTPAAITLLFVMLRIIRQQQAARFAGLHFALIVCAMVYGIITLMSAILYASIYVGWFGFFTWVLEYGWGLYQIPGNYIMSSIIFDGSRAGTVLLAVLIMHRWLREKYRVITNRWTFALPVAVYSGIEIVGACVMTMQSNNAGAGVPPGSYALAIARYAATTGVIGWCFVGVVQYRRSVTDLLSRVASGHCVQCGYNLEAIESDNCPECGFERDGHAGGLVAPIDQPPITPLPRNDRRVRDSLDNSIVGGMLVMIAAIAEMIVIGARDLLLIAGIPDPIWYGLRLLDLFICMFLAFAAVRAALPAPGTEHDPADRATRFWVRMTLGVALVFMLPIALPVVLTPIIATMDMTGWFVDRWSGEFSLRAGHIRLICIPIVACAASAIYLISMHRLSAQFAAYYSTDIKRGYAPALVVALFVTLSGAMAYVERLRFEARFNPTELALHQTPLLILIVLLFILAYWSMRYVAMSRRLRAILIDETRTERP